MDSSLHSQDWLGRTVEVVMDRPMGSTHPRYPDLVMEVNYGFVPGTLAPDGAPLDVYVLGAQGPLPRCRATVIAVIRRRDDVEDKLVAAVGGEWDARSIRDAVAFQERYFDIYIELPSTAGAVVTGGAVSCE